MFNFPFIVFTLIFSVASLFGISSFCGLLIMCLTYQASSGIYLLLIFFYAFLLYKEDTNWKKIASFILYAGALYLGSLLVYKLFFMQKKRGRLFVIGFAPHDFEGADQLFYDLG